MTTIIFIDIDSKRGDVVKEGVVRTGTVEERMRRQEGGHGIHRDTQGRI
jgi:hypothetical protein